MPGRSCGIAHFVNFMWHNWISSGCGAALKCRGILENAPFQPAECSQASHDPEHTMRPFSLLPQGHSANAAFQCLLLVMFFPDRRMEYIHGENSAKSPSVAGVAPPIFMVSLLSVYHLICSLTVRRVFSAQITVGYVDFAVICCWTRKVSILGKCYIEQKCIHLKTLLKHLFG